MSNCWEATRPTDIWRWWSLLFWKNYSILNTWESSCHPCSTKRNGYIFCPVLVSKQQQPWRDKTEQEILLSHSPFGFALTLQVLPFWFWSLFYCKVSWKFQTEASSTRCDLSVFHRNYFCLPLALLGALRDEVARLSQLLAEERRLVASLEAEIVELVHGRKLQGKPYSTYVHKYTSDSKFSSSLQTAIS